MSVEQEADRLTGLWRESLRRKHLEDSEAADYAEQAAYDRLIDYVEANGLNYSKHDPRSDW